MQNKTHAVLQKDLYVHCAVETTKAFIFVYGSIFHVSFFWLALFHTKQFTCTEITATTKTKIRRDDFS